MKKGEEQLELFVPGRLCLFGEHSDWAGWYTTIDSEVCPGHAIVTGIDLGLYARVEKSDRFEMSSLDRMNNRVEFSCDMNPDTLLNYARESGFFSYACGVASYLLENYKISGIRITIDRVTLPIAKGLSSSAAVCVLVARSFNRIYKLRLSTNGEMSAAYHGELRTGSRCGRLDQGCAYGIRPVSMEFDGGDISVRKLKVESNLYWVFADLMAKKNTKKILNDLNKCYPFAQNEVERNIHDALGKDNIRIIKKAEAAISEGDAKRVGEIMKEAQELFDSKVAPACIEELAAPKLHKVLEDSVVNELTYGGKGVGSQGDGTVQFIAKDEECQKKLVEYLNKSGLEAHAFTIPSSHSVRKAIIPLAGFGTRMYPETRFVKKAFLPVYGEDGQVKPVIMCLLEELDAAGMEEIILIVGEDEVESYREMFEKSLSEEHLSKLPNHVRDYEMKISRIGKKLRYVVQKERRGFGHAVYQAVDYVGKAPVFLTLGDFVYRSREALSCTEQTIEAFKKSSGQLTVSVKRIPLQDVVHYGIVTGSFEGKDEVVLTATDMYEKPAVDYAEDYLPVDDKEGKSYYATFGQYVLTPDVFEGLKEEIDRADRLQSSEEIQLTSVLSKVCKEKGMIGVHINGDSYDVGIPKAYLDTIELTGNRVMK